MIIATPANTSVGQLVSESAISDHIFILENLTDKFVEKVTQCTAKKECLSRINIRFENDI